MKSARYMDEQKPVIINTINEIWSHKGSPIGFCFESPDKKYRYVPVSKCMSDTLSTWCDANGWSRITDFNVETNLECKYIVVLRDPVQRWCSGVEMWLRTEHRGIDAISDDAWSICLDTMMLDPHTERQCISYTGLNLHHIIPINFESPDFSIFKRLQASARTELSVLYPFKGLTVNKNEERSRPDRIVKFLKNERQIQRLQHIYRYDYYLRHWLLDIDLPKFENMDYNDPSIWKD